jgi:succinate dehydrogenase/fumarate reductase flavoprotein subunit
VVLATGGFSHDATLRKRFFPPAAGFISATHPSATGDGLRLATVTGAALNTDATSPAYWVPASLFRRADGSRGVFPHTATDRAKPGVIAVNAAGRRFANEALSYHEFVLAMLRDGDGESDRPFSDLRPSVPVELRPRPHQAVHPQYQTLCGERRVGRGR